MTSRRSSASSTDKESALIEQALAELRTQKRVPGANNPRPTTMPSSASKSERAAKSMKSTKPVKSALPTPPLPEAPQPATPFDAERTIKIAIPIRRRPAAPPPAAPKHTVFAPAGMNPELATKIALMMEQGAEERERKRVKGRRMVVIWAGAGLVMLFGGLGIGLMTSPPPGVKPPRAVASQIHDDRHATPPSPSPPPIAPPVAQPPIAPASTTPVQSE